MKIGFVLDDGLDKPDGVQQYILTLGSWYAANGHEVRYLVGETNRPDLDHVYSMAKNVKVRFNGNALSIPLPASTKHIKKVLTQEKFDVIHVQVPYSPFMGAKVVKRAHSSAAIVGTFHILPYGWLSRVGTRLLGIWLKRNLKHFDKMLSVSQPAADFAAQSFKVSSTVVPNAVDMQRYKPQLVSSQRSTNNALRLLFVGRLVHRKGCQQLIEALTILHKKQTLPANLQVDICGDGPLRPQLEATVSAAGMESFITFHGFVSEAQKISFMQQADIAVFPSLSGESFGIVLIEAMAAAGGVVLGGDNPGYRSVLHATPEAIINVHDVNSMARQLETVIIDSAGRQALHKAQQELVQQFDVARVAGQVMDVYNTCINNKTSR